MRIAIVNVEPVARELDENDHEIAGEYEVTLSEHVTEPQIADVALDVFHANIPIKRLECFTFTVLFNGQVMEPDPEHDTYTLQHLGRL